MTLGELIKQYRIDNDLGLRDLAQRAGMSNSYLSMLETGRKSSTKQPIVPTLTKLNQLADAMGLRVDDLIAMIDDIPIELDSPRAIRVPVSEKARKTVARNILKFMTDANLTASEL
jgi:transcriptional regulator with XRE-family HTH domain